MKISVHREQFLAERTERTRLGSDPVGKVDGQTIQTIIHGFSPWQRLKYGTVRRLYETGFSFSAYVAVFRNFCLQLVR